MASKRVAASAIDWTELAKKIPDAQKTAFTALKMKQDGHIRTIGQLPEKLPVIEWAKYQGRVVPAFLDEFRNKYESLSIPYPKDTIADKINVQAAEQKKTYDNFVRDSKTRVAQFAEELAKWEAMMPLYEMNKEELMQAAPHLVPEHRPGKPEFWPFDEDFDAEKKKRLVEEHNRTYWDQGGH